MYFNRHTIPNALRALWRIFRSAFVAEELTISDNHTQAVRAARCQVCPYSADGQCKLCTCYIDLKVMFATEECPASPPRWRKQTAWSNGL